VELPKGPELHTVDFESWYREESVRLVRVLTLALAEPDLAQDSADEAFSRAYERWPRVSAMESPTGWTYKVALNYGRRRLLRRRFERALLLRQTRERPAEGNSASGRDMDLWRIVSSLPPRQRTAIVLRYLGDFSELQVAQLMGISAGAASSSLSSARGRLAELLTGDIQESRPEPEGDSWTNKQATR
jgi:RNA polymerase sigma factor (sigma-70 family)